VAALTRRQALLAGGVAAVAAAGFGLWGRFALGGAFEQHVADRLGLDRGLTEAILRGMREELDDYELRASAFLIATEGPSSVALPEEVRRDAVDAFITPMFGESRAITMRLVYAGTRDTIDYTPCKVLRRRA
jgi:hypothetical protein